MFPDITIPGWLLSEKRLEMILADLDSFVGDFDLSSPELDDLRAKLIVLLSIHQRTEIRAAEDGTFDCIVSPLN